MYREDEHVICRGLGVCRIVRMEENALYYVCPFPDGDATPVPREDVVRPIMGRDAAREVVERVPYLRTIQAPSDKVYEELLMVAFSKYDALEWVAIVKSSYMRQKHGKARAFEQSYAERAKAYLHGELSLALSIPLDGVEAYIGQSIAEDL